MGALGLLHVVVKNDLDIRLYGSTVLQVRLLLSAWFAVFLCKQTCVLISTR